MKRQQQPNYEALSDRDLVVEVSRRNPGVLNIGFSYSKLDPGSPWNAWPSSALLAPESGSCIKI
jgi:hypothetical protein